MKTGTSFLQQLLVRNKDNLARAGYLFPGETWKDQARAGRDLMRIFHDDERLRRLCRGAWDRVADEMAGYDGNASIFSMEFLSFADAKRAKQAVRSLTGRGAVVHVILVARDTIGALPAQWQSDTRSGGLLSWPEFARGARSVLDGSRGAERTGARVFARTQGIPRMLDAWGAAVPPGRLHVVTVPRSGADPMLLWERFAEVVGIDPAVCTPTSRRNNTSLGQASAELVRRVNLELGKVPASDFRATVKQQLASRVLTKRAHLESRAKLDAPTLDFAADWNRRVREAIERSGVRMVGDLDDLPVEVPPELRDAAVPELADPDDDEILAAAVTARDGLHGLIDRRVEALRDLGVDEALLDPVATLPWEPASEERWTRHPDPVGSAVTELTDLVRVAMALQRQVDRREGAA
jgi:hypothetical protein